MTTRCVSSLMFMAAAAAVCLGPAQAAGQPPATPSVQKEAAGCPGEPAPFVPCAREKAKTFNPPRTPDGKPDLSGYWATARQAFILEEHAPDFGTRGETSMIVDPPDGKIPFTPAAAAKRHEREVKHVDPPSADFIDPSARCFTKGVPRQNINNPFPIRVVQTPATVVILSEQNHAYQIIPISSAPHVGKNIKLWMGDSRGRWEGNTLVAETTNHNGLAWLDETGAFFSDTAKVTEKFTLIDKDVIFYEATIEDPAVFTRPWTMAYPIRRNTDAGIEIYEFACHEGNKSPSLQLGTGIGK